MGSRVQAFTPHSRNAQAAALLCDLTTFSAQKQKDAWRAHRFFVKVVEMRDTMSLSPEVERILVDAGFVGVVTNIEPRPKLAESLQRLATAIPPPHGAGVEGMPVEEFWERRSTTFPSSSPRI